MMHFLNYLFFGKQDLINSGLKSFLNITQPDKEKSKKLFRNKYPDTPQETLDSYFTEYKLLYDFAETNLSNLYKFQVNKRLVKKNFIDAISARHKWIDKPNMEKLYDVCRFNLK